MLGRKDTYFDEGLEIVVKKFDLLGVDLGPSY